MIVNEHTKPANYLSVVNWERGTDPFHRSAMPKGFEQFANNGDLANGWFGIDWCGNQICFVRDGTEVEE